MRQKVVGKIGRKVLWFIIPHFVSNMFIGNSRYALVQLNMGGYTTTSGIGNKVFGIKHDAVQEEVPPPGPLGMISNRMLPVPPEGKNLSCLCLSFHCEIILIH